MFSMIKEALNKQGNIQMLTWKENMTMNTSINITLLVQCLFDHC